jgi:hypothetical protein
VGISLGVGISLEVDVSLEVGFSLEVGVSLEVVVALGSGCLCIVMVLVGAYFLDRVLTGQN